MVKYQKLKNQEKKAEFRLEWAKEQEKKEQSVRGSSHTKEWRDFNVEKGTYHPLARIFIEEGGQ
eukprot:1775686-Heterocapsa_arctica.AAC.1